VSDLLAAEGLRALFFTGQERTRRRTQNLVIFTMIHKPSCCFSATRAAWELNLQKAANACINLELPWNPAVLGAADRAHSPPGPEAPHRRVQPGQPGVYRGAHRRNRG